MIWLIILALGCGALMNLMPCVLPVLALKLRAFQGGGRLAYVSGVMLSFMVLATLSMALGTGLSQMGFTGFRVGLVLICGLMATHLWHWWEMPSFGVRGNFGPFGMGLLTTALGSSCSVPFLAPVLVYTTTCPWWETYLLFGALGVGFCSPFLLPLRGLGIMSDIGGLWFERVFGVIMLAISLGIGATLPLETLGVTVILFCIIQNCILMMQKVTGILRLAVIGAVPAVALVLFFCIMPAPVQPEQPDLWPTTGPRVIFVTADWCLNCKAAKLTLDDAEVQHTMLALGITPIYLDYTNRDPAIRRFLESHGHRDVPMCLVENGIGEVTILSGLWLPVDLRRALGDITCCLSFPPAARNFF